MKTEYLKTLYQLDIGNEPAHKISFVYDMLQMYANAKSGIASDVHFEFSPVAASKVQEFSDYLSKVFTTPEIKVSVGQMYHSTPPTFDLLYYSNGVESLYLAVKNPLMPKLNLNGIDYRYDHGVEFPLLALAHLLGFNPVIGSENGLEYEKDYPFVSDQMRKLIIDIFSVEPKFPIFDSGKTKLDVLRELALTSHHTLPTPCFNAEQATNHSCQHELLANYKATGNLYYCGNCYKCWAMHVMYALPCFEVKPHFKISNTCLTRHVQNLLNFNFETGKYARDMTLYMSVTEFLMEQGLSIEEFWANFLLTPEMLNTIDKSIKSYNLNPKLFIHV